jgi:hypothetical protein
MRDARYPRSAFVDWAIPDNGNEPPIIIEPIAVAYVENNGR